MRTVKSVLAGVIILLGLVALLVRSAAPFIADYRPTIEAKLSVYLGAQVEIDAIAARWYGLRPLIELRGIRLSQDDDRLTIDRAGIDIAPTGLLGLLVGDARERLVEAVRLTLDGLALTAVRESDGRIHLEGLGPIGSTSENDRPPALPLRLQLTNTRLTWIDRKAGTPPLTIPDLAILLQRDGPRLDLRARLETTAGTADAAARLEGSLTTTNWSGNSFLRVADLDVARLLTPYLPSYYGLRSLRLNAETWIRWNHARPAHSVGEFSLRQLRLRPTVPGSGELDLAAASASFSLRRDNDRVLIGLKDLRLAMPEHIWPEANIAVAFGRDADGPSVDLSADYLDLTDVSQIARVRLPWPEVAAALDGLRPRGTLRDLRLRLRLLDTGPDWRGRAQVEGLALAPWGGAPGIAGVSARLEGQTGLARLRLNSQNSTLQFPSLFRRPLALDRITGAVELAYSSAGWSARSDHLVANAPHLETTTRFALRQRPGDGLFLDLQTDFADADASAASLYLPTGVMRPRLVQWLDQAIESGRVERGSALFHGPIEDFAFEKTRSGSFEVVFETSDVDLHYRPGWPALEQLAARVQFRGNRLDIQSLSGRIYGSAIEQLTARVPSLKPVSPLEVTGTLTGPLADPLRALQEDALRDRFGWFAAALRGGGDTRLDLDFTIPLGGRGSYRLDGSLRFLDAELALPARRLELADIDGVLALTLDGISARGIRARALGRPAVIDVFALDGGGTRVRTTARLAPKDIARQLPALPLQIAEGRSRFVVDVDIRPEHASGERSAVLNVTSDLDGTAVQLPEPLGKAAGERRPLAVRIPLGEGGEPGSLRYADTLAARFAADGTRIGVAVGGESAELPTGTGLRLIGRVEELDTKAWEAALSRLVRPGAAELPSVDVELDIARLVHAPMALDEVALALQHRSGDWQGRIRAPAVVGRFRVPADLEAGRVELDLDQLTLSYAISESTEPTPAPNPANATDPTGLPELTLSIGRLRVNESDLGELKLDATKGPDGLSFTSLTLTGGSLELDARGRWTKGPGGIETRVDGTASTESLGDLWVALGYSRQLEQAPGKIQWDLGWPGDPSQMHDSTLSGHISVDIGAGRLVELDPGVTRVVGLLNLNALARRLRLDFSDFYRKGYSFDRITGDFEFRDGIALTDDFLVTGPTGRIDLKGRADLRARTLDQRVQVTPNLNAALPIAGAIAGGPIAGVAVLVAQEVLSAQVDEINRFEYAVTGDWADPNIRQLDSGGPLSKLLGPLRRGGGAADAPDVSTAPTAPIGDGSEARGAQSIPVPEAVQPAPDADGDDSPLTRPIRGLLEFLKNGEVDTGNLLIDQD